MCGVAAYPVGVLYESVLTFTNARARGVLNRVKFFSNNPLKLNPISHGGEGGGGKKSATEMNLKFGIFEFSTRSRPNFEQPSSLEF